ncbi:hypothetical protein N0V90_007376 [Kalmusia sp. IMI 367209]|nr:hypothetical protein N0V90_007376 [Kalmusia sp. IMI 367209]
MAWIETLRSAPACTQFATSRLLTDCQLHDNPSEFVMTHPDQNLEDVQNEYALKLALCEYVGAQHDHQIRPRAPPKCHAFLPSTEACGKRSWLWGKTEAPNDELCYQKATKSDLTQCLMTMQSSAQTWISYSNARSRAMHICHLSRRHIDKEQDLQLYKNFTVLVAKLRDSVYSSESMLQTMNDKMQEQLDDSRRSFEDIQRSTEDWMTFVKEAQRQFQRDLAQTEQGVRNVQLELESLHQRSIIQSTSLSANFDARMEVFLAKFMNALGHAQNNTIAKMTKDMDIYYQESKKERSDQLERYDAELQDVHEKGILALELQHKAIMESFDIIQKGLDNETLKVVVMSEKHDILGSKQDDSLTKAYTLVDVLGTLGSLAQGIVAMFETFSTIISSVKGIIVGMMLLTACFSTAYLFGNIIRKLTLKMLALLNGVCFIGYAISRSLSIPAMPGKSSETLAQVESTDNKSPWAQITIGIFLVACILMFHLKSFDFAPDFVAGDPNQVRLRFNRAA